jgi:alkylation response protein AidB-like acyl-CoA dehydrogenase
MPFIDRTILDFLLYDWLDAAALTKLPRFSEHSRETFDAVLDLSARVADDHFAPHAKKSDRNEPVFAGETVHVLPDIKAALQAYSEAGLFAATFDEALGGAQIPALIHTASTALTMAANIATAAYPMLTVASAPGACRQGASQRFCIPVRPRPCGRGVALARSGAGSGRRLGHHA